MKKASRAKPLPRVRLGRPIAVRTYPRTNPDLPRIVLEIGKPRKVRGWDWACPVRITGLAEGSSEPRPVFGIDAVQAIELAIQYSHMGIEGVLLEEMVKPARKRPSR